MARQVQSEGLALAGEPHRLAPLRQFHDPDGSCGRGAPVGREAEHIVLAGLMGLGVLLAELHRRRQALHEGGAVDSEAVEAPGAQQRFQHPAVDLLQVEAAA